MDRVIKGSLGGGVSLILAWCLGCIPASGALLLFDRSISQDAPYFTDITLDVAGNLYLSGFAVVASVPRALVVKRSPDGVNEVWSLQFGAGQGQIATGISVDVQGNVYVTGWTSDPNFPLKNPLQGKYGGGDNDVFILKINPAGTSVIYSTFLGGSDKDFANQIRTDSAGNVFVTGTTFSRDFPGAAEIIAGGSDAFVVKVNPEGSAVLYSRLLGGSGSEFGNGMRVDGQGRAYVIGSTTSTNLPVKNPMQSDNRGGSDAFVGILDASGSPEYLSYLGGSAPEFGTGIALDSTGNILLTGLTYSEDFPLVHPFQNRLQRGNCSAQEVCGDAFVAKLDSTGSVLEFSTYLGGNGRENDNAITSPAGFTLYGIAVDASGFIYVSGSTESSDFPVLGGLQVSRRRGSSDPFLAKLQPDGAIVYSAYLGPGQLKAGQIWASVGSSLFVDSHGNAYVAGASVPPKAGPGANQGSAGYIAKVFDLPMIPTRSSSLPGSSEQAGFLPITDFRRLADLSSQFNFAVPTNAGYVVESSIDLRAWTPLFTQPPPGQPDGTGGGGGKR